MATPLFEGRLSIEGAKRRVVKEVRIVDGPSLDECIKIANNQVRDGFGHPITPCKIFILEGPKVLSSQLGF